MAAKIRGTLDEGGGRGGVDGGGGVGFQNLLPRLEWLYLTLAGEGAEGERDS